MERVGRLEDKLARHARQRREGIGVVSVLVGAPASWLDALRAHASTDEATFTAAWSGWHAAARALAREAALASVARATGRALDEVGALIEQGAAEAHALVARAAASHLPPIDRGIHEALEGRDVREDVEIARALASLGAELPTLLLERPSLARLAWALRAVEACPALPIVVSLRPVDLELAERELPRSLADRMRAGVIAAPGSSGFRDAAGAYAPILAEPLAAAWSEAANAMKSAEPDRARSLAERLLFRALESLPETRGLFALNLTLPGVRFGPRDVEIDLLARSIRVAIEVDGPFHFVDADAYRRDRRKDALLQRNGLLVSRVLAGDVVERLGEVLDAVLENVRHARWKENTR